jgi:Smg protein
MRRLNWEVELSRNNLKILRMIASYPVTRGGASDGVGDIKWLLCEGFSPEEIEEACSWLKGLTLNGDLCMAIRDSSGNFYTNRVLSNAEALKISEDAYGFLIRLREMGLIDSRLQEEIIEMAMLAAEDEIGMDDIKGITAMLIFDYSPGQWKSDMMDALNDRWEEIYH